MYDVAMLVQNVLVRMKFSPCEMTFLKRWENPQSRFSFFFVAQRKGFVIHNLHASTLLCPGCGSIQSDVCILGLGLWSLAGYEVINISKSYSTKCAIRIICRRVEQKINLIFLTRVFKCMLELLPRIIINGNTSDQSEDFAPWKIQNND